MVAVDTAASQDGNVVEAPCSLEQLVHLNVGGVRYSTTFQTLQTCWDAKLGQMFRGLLPSLRDEDGVFYIDRDGRVFRHILNYLRDGSLPLGLSRVERLELLREAKFYGIEDLHALLGGTQDPHDSILGVRREGESRIRGGCADMGEDPRFVDSYGPLERRKRLFCRLRYGHEYQGGWVVSSPRNLPGVEYELHGACLARSILSAINKLSAAGWRTCEDPPKVPPITELSKLDWGVGMYKDIRTSPTSLSTLHDARHAQDTFSA